MSAFVFSVSLLFSPLLPLQASLAALVFSTHYLAESVDPSDDQCSSFRETSSFLYSFFFFFSFPQSFTVCKTNCRVGERLFFLPSTQCHLSWKWFSLISAANRIISLPSYFDRSLMSPSEWGTCVRVIGIQTFYHTLSQVIGLIFMFIKVAQHLVKCCF